MSRPDPERKIRRRSRSKNHLEQKAVKHFFFSEEQQLPLVVQAEYPGLDLKVWLTAHSERVRKELDQYGAILFRNFANASTEEFDQVARSWNPLLMDYDFGSTPRTNLQSGIYTSTEYPADQEIAMHNEMAYTKRYPAYLWFYCHQPAEEGGRTPLADSRKVYQMLRPDTVARFEARKVLYCRNYRPGIDVPWTSVFRTTKKAEVEAFCEAQGIVFEWVSEDHLRTKEACAGVIRHPHTGEKVWFNQAHLFHPSNLSEEVIGQLGTIPEEDLPRNVYWEDGAPIDPALLQEVRDVYKKVSVKFDWQAGDMLLVDNLLVSHGREPYNGRRKILVAMQSELNTTS